MTPQDNLWWKAHDAVNHGTRHIVDDMLAALITAASVNGFKTHDIKASMRLKAALVRFIHECGNTNTGLPEWIAKLAAEQS
jgi:hypothetical protein